MYADHAKLNRCKKLLETPVKVDRNKEPAPMGKTETPPSEESRFGRRKSSARRWVV